MISVVILTTNEEKNIKNCLSCLSWSDEIIVVGTLSNDKTIQVTKTIGVGVFIHPINNDFSAQRNFGLEKTKGEWVLFIDADEIVTNELKNEILQVVSQETSFHQVDGYYLRRKDILWGRELKYGEAGTMKLIRLGRKNSGQWVGKVHERWDIKGNIGILKNPLYHYPHKSLEEFLRKIDFYTDIRAQELYENNAKVYWWSIMAYPLGKFFVNYVLKKGFLDRIPGLIHAIVMSFHSFLVRGKLWLIWHRADQKQ